MRKVLLGILFFKCLVFFNLNASSANDLLAAVRQSNTDFMLAKGTASSALNQAIPSALTDAYSKADYAFKKTQQDANSLFSDVKSKLTTVKTLTSTYPADFSQTNDTASKLQTFFTRYDAFVNDFTTVINGMATTDVIPMIKSVKDEKINSIKSALSQSGRLDGGVFKSGVERSIQALFADFEQKVSYFYTSIIDELSDKVDREKQPVSTLPVSVVTPTVSPAPVPKQPTPSVVPEPKPQPASSQPVVQKSSSPVNIKPPQPPAQAVAPVNQTPVGSVPASAPANAMPQQVSATAGAFSTVTPSNQSSVAQPFVVSQPASVPQDSSVLIPLEPVQQSISESSPTAASGGDSSMLMQLEQTPQVVPEMPAVGTSVGEPGMVMPLEPVGADASAAVSMPVG